MRRLVKMVKGVENSTTPAPVGRTRTPLSPTMHAIKVNGASVGTAGGAPVYAARLGIYDDGSDAWTFPDDVRIMDANGYPLPDATYFLCRLVGTYGDYPLYATDNAGLTIKGYGSVVKHVRTLQLKHTVFQLTDAGSGIVSAKFRDGDTQRVITHACAHKIVRDGRTYITAVSGERRQIYLAPGQSAGATACVSDPTDCCSVTSPCCGSAALPETLYLTLSGGSALCVAAVYPLRYTGSLWQFAGTITGGTCVANTSLTAQIYCASGVLYLGLDLTCDPTGHSTCTVDLTAAGVTCSPFSASGTLTWTTAATPECTGAAGTPTSDWSISV